MRRKFLGNEHPRLATSLECLAEVLRDNGELDEAGILLRECLTIRERRLPDDWPTSSARSALGENLLQHKEYEEAERLLLSGFDGLKELQARIPAGSKRYLTAAVERLIRLYEETDRPVKAAEWHRKLGELTESVPEPESGTARRQN